MTINTINPSFGEDWQQRLQQDLADSTGLPNEAYTDPTFLQWENQQLLPRSWVLAGFVHEVPNVGDAIPVVVADKPLIVARKEGGEIVVLHNVCPHRGAKMLEQPCSAAKQLRCPNHRWAFGLDGKVQARPHFFGGGQHDIHASGEGPQGMLVVRSGTWNGMVFVNLDGQEQSLEDYLLPMTSRLTDYDLSSLNYAGTLEWTLNANWKLIHENFIEPYHVFAVHPGLIKFGPMERRRASDHQDHCFYNDYQFPEAEEGRGMGLPYYPNLPERAQQQALWFHLFPSLSLEFFPDQMAVWELRPASPGVTEERIHLFLIGEGATSPEYEQQRQQVVNTWHALNEEDIDVIERMQRGRSSPGFTGGMLSPHWDGAIQHYARLMAAAMAKS